MATTTAIVRVSAPTSTGNQDITTVELGGLTPKAALFFMSGGVSDDSSADHGRIAYGATDGVVEWYMGARSEDGVGTTETTRACHTTGVIGLIDTNAKAKDSEAEFVTFIANGIRINWTNAPSVAHKLTVIFFAGADLEVDCDVIDTDLEDVDVNVTAPGFEPDILFAGFNNRDFDSGMDDGVGGHHEYGFGVSKNPGDSGIAEGVGQSNNDRDGQASAEVTSSVADDRSAFHVKDGTYRTTIEFSDFDADGFTATPRDNDGKEFGYLALKMPDTLFEIGIYNTPTSTGDDSKTGVGFAPDTVLFGMSFFDGALTDPPTVTTDDFSYGISAFTDAEESSVSIQTQDSVGTSNTKSIADAKAINLPQDNGAVGFKATFVSMDIDGWTLNYSNAVGTSRKFWFIAIGVQPDAQGQVSFTELQLLDEAQGQVSVTEFEVPDPTSGQVSFGEFEAPDVPAKGTISFATLETPIQAVEARFQASQVELETPDVNDLPRGQVGTAEFETPDVLINAQGQISQTELRVTDPSGGDGLSVVSFTEFELPDADSLHITNVKLETTEPRRRGRVGWARLEYASVSGENRVTKIKLKDFNRDQLLEELAVYGIVPDNGFFMPGFDNLEDDQRIWTPRPGAPPSPEFRDESFVSAELWFEYSFVLTAEDEFNLDFVLAQHVAGQTTDEDSEDEDTEDFIQMRDYFDRWEFLTRAEKDDAICRLTRQMLRLHGGELGEGI